MADMEWYKNLAEANFENGKWTFEDSEKVEKLLSFKMKTVINNLFDEATDAIEVFNQHALNRPKINLLPISDTYSSSLVGFVALLETTQVKLVRKNQTLELYLINISGHNPKTTLLHTFSPCYDALGSLLWQTKTKNLVNHDIIIKMVFEELVKGTASS
jgi:hypothetical protein